jgi:sugar/nucleoside kinase (ribokinase family)
MAKDEGSLRRLGGGRWQTRDGRYTIESGSGRWAVVDAEQSNELGLPLVLGPFGSLGEAKAAIANLRVTPSAVSPLAERLAEARRRNADRRATGDAGARGRVGGSPDDDSALEPSDTGAANPEPPAATPEPRPPLVPPRLRRVLVIGHASWNTMIRVAAFPGPGPAAIRPLGWHETVGASGAGKAIALARLGIPVTLLAPLGNDEAGRRVRAALGAIDGLELRPILDPSGTARHVNLMDPAGARQSFLLHTGDDGLAADPKLVERLVRAADLVFLERTAVARAALAVVTRLGRPVWADLHDWDDEPGLAADLLAAAEVATLSTARLPDPRPALERAIAAGRRLVVATGGADGAIALTEDGDWLDVAAAHVAEIVDANGAGDAFAAGLLLGLALDRSIAEALAIAARAGALSLGSRDLSGPELTRAAVTAGG